MKILRWPLLALALLTAAPVAGQQIVCGGVRLPLAPNLPAVRDTALKRVADSIPCIRTNGSAATQLRNRLAIRADSLSRRAPPAPPVDTMPPIPPDTSIVRCNVSPSSGPIVLVGDTLRFRAACYDAEGAERATRLAWRVGNPPVASVDQTGLARGLAVGFSDVYATATPAVEAVSRLQVLAAADTVPEPPPPPTPGICTFNITGTINGNVTIPDGQRGCIVGTVEIRDGSLLCSAGTLQMRAGSRLRFVNSGPGPFQGGGIHYMASLDSDRGLWVWGTCQLDLVGTTKAGWNRTGSDPTWAPNDEYWITPTDVGDYRPRRWTPGQPIPRAGASVPSAEVVNVTRDCVIEAAPGSAAHVHINSNKVQRIEYCQFKNLGVWKVGSESPVLGRYCLHLHMQGDASRGTVIRGNAMTDCKAFGYVAHVSHGVTMVDNVLVNGWEAGMWWDQFSRSDDFLWDRGLITGINTPDSIRGVQSDADAYNLHAGRNAEIRNSVAAGVNGDKLAVCFDWVQPQATDPDAQAGLFVWKFDTGNVAHNCRGPGARFSTNLQEAHHVQNFVTYRNAGSSVENGAYVSSTRYTNLTTFEDGYRTQSDNSYEVGGFIAWANASVTAGIYNSTISSREGPAIYVTNRQLPAESCYTIQNVILIPAAGQPKIFVGPGVQETKPWRACITGTDVTPDDIVFATSIRNEGSVIDIDHPNGTRWRVSYVNGQKVVTLR